MLLGCVTRKPDAIDPNERSTIGDGLEATAFQVENIRIANVFYESGLSINVMYTIDDPKRRAVGFKLSEGMEVPPKLASKFKNEY